MVKWNCRCGAVNKQTAEKCQKCNGHWTKVQTGVGKPKDKGPKDRDSSKDSSWPTLHLPAASRASGQSAGSASQVAPCTVPPNVAPSFPPVGFVQTAASIPSPFDALGMTAPNAQVPILPVAQPDAGNATQSSGSHAPVAQVLKQLQDVCSQFHFVIPDNIQTALQEQMQSRSMQSQLHSEANRLGKYERKISSLERTIAESVQSWHSYIVQVKNKLHQDHQKCLQVIRAAEQELGHTKESLKQQQQATFNYVQRMCNSFPTPMPTAEGQVSMEIDGNVLPQPWMPPVNGPDFHPQSNQAIAPQTAVPTQAHASGLPAPDISVPFPAANWTSMHMSVPANQPTSFAPQSFYPGMTQPFAMHLQGSQMTGFPQVNPHVQQCKSQLHSSCYHNGQTVAPGPPPSAMQPGPPPGQLQQAPAGVDPYADLRSQKPELFNIASPEQTQVTPLQTGEQLDASAETPFAGCSDLQKTLTDCATMMSQGRQLFTIATTEQERIQAHQVFEHASQLYASVAQQRNLHNPTTDAMTDPALEPILQAVEQARQIQAECHGFFKAWVDMSAHHLYIKPTAFQCQTAQFQLLQRFGL